MGRGQGERGRRKLAKPRSQSLQLPPHFPTELPRHSSNEFTSPSQFCAWQVFCVLIAIGGLKQQQGGNSHRAH